jgi:hypothetical protein
MVTEVFTQQLKCYIKKITTPDRFIPLFSFCIKTKKEYVAILISPLAQ